MVLYTAAGWKRDHFDRTLRSPDCAAAARNASAGAATLAEATTPAYLRSVIVRDAMFPPAHIVSFLDDMPCAGWRLTLISHELDFKIAPNHTGAWGP